MNMITDWFVDRFAEKTTWVGLMVLLSTFGIGGDLTTEQQGAIVSFCVLLVIRPEKNDRKK